MCEMWTSPLSANQFFFPSCSGHVSLAKTKYQRLWALWMINQVPDTTEWLGPLLPLRPISSHPPPPPAVSGQRNHAAYVCTRGDRGQTGNIFPFHWVALISSYSWEKAGRHNHLRRMRSAGCPSFWAILSFSSWYGVSSGTLRAMV